MGHDEIEKYCRPRPVCIRRLFSSARVAFSPPVLLPGLVVFPIVRQVSWKLPSARYGVCFSVGDIPVPIKTFYFTCNSSDKSPISLTTAQTRKVPRKQANLPRNVVSYEFSNEPQFQQCVAMENHKTAEHKVP